MQRDWRRRGFLPPQPSRPVHSKAQEVATILVLNALNKTGYRLSFARTLADRIGKAVFVFALLNNSDAAIGVVGPRSSCQKFRKDLPNNEALLYEMAGVTLRDAGQYLILGDGLEKIVHDPRPEMEGAEFFNVVNLKIVADRFCQLAKKPLVTVDLLGSPK